MNDRDHIVPVSVIDAEAARAERVLEEARATELRMAAEREAALGGFYFSFADDWFVNLGDIHAKLRKHSVRSGRWTVTVINDEDTHRPVALQFVEQAA